MKLNVLAFALAAGILWGLGVFLMTWWLIIIEDMVHNPMMLERIYVGYHLTPLGSIIGLIWGFFDAFIGAGILAWLYNRFVNKFQS